MPIDDLTALGQKMREARKRKDLTQQELSDLSHVSVKQIAKIEKGQMNPSFLILKALAKVLPISLDSLINPDVSPEDEGAGQMKMLYCSCPSEMRETLLHHTQETMKEARPVFLHDDIRIKAHFLICFLSLVIYRYLERELEHVFTCETILDKLKTINFADIQAQGFIPLYTRDKLTDALHGICGFDTDFKFITKSHMKTIQKKSKGRK